MSGRFAGRTALVTGSSSGIGAGIAAALLAEGARVFGADLVPTAAEPGARFTALTVDVTDEASVEAAFADAGELDVVVHAAGASRGAPIETLDRATWDFTVGLVLTGTYLVVKHAAAAVRDGGSIVTIGSLNGRVPMYGGAAYVSAKAGVEAFTRTAAIEFAPRGVRVNCVLPGLVETPLTASFRGDPAIGAAMNARIPLHRPGSVAEVAGPVLFLASDAASYVTGASLVVDGGWELAAYPDLRGMLPEA